MNVLHAFHFLRPWWLLALVILPLLPWLLKRGGGMAALQRLVDPRLLPFLLQGSARRRIGTVLGAVVAWILATLAMAGPTWQRLPQPVYAGHSAQVVVASMSRRMLATDVRPDRLTRVRYKIHDLLKSNQDGQNALVAYAGAAFTVAPLTSDADALTDLLDALSPNTMPVSGNNAAAGIRRATKLLLGSGDKSGSIVLIDDHADSKARTAAAQAREKGMRVSVLGVGTAKGAPYTTQDASGFQRKGNGQARMARRDDASLRAVARAGGGRYVRMRNDGQDIAALKTQLRHSAGARDTKHHASTWIDRGPWLLLLLLPLAALAFRRGTLLALALLVLLPMSWTPAHAGGWNDAWRTRDQQAARALAQGHPKKAQKLAQDPALRGTSAYRAGDYKSAARDFARASGARNQYNLGNALARMQQYQKALKAYDRALKANPKLADARANRKAIEDWLKKQRKSKPPKSSKQGTSKSDQHSKPSDSGKSSQDKHSKSSSGKKSGKGKSSPGTPGKSPQSDKPKPGSKPSHAPGKGDKQQQPKASSQAQNKAGQQARQAQKKRMDKALGRSSSAAKPYALGKQPDTDPGKGKKLPATMRRALQQVKDDPGGLLRRKFMLEYQQRKQRGDVDASQPPTQGNP